MDPDLGLIIFVAFIVIILTVCIVGLYRRKTTGRSYSRDGGGGSDGFFFSGLGADDGGGGGDGDGGGD